MFHYHQGLICVGTVGNAVPILIFRWERRSHTYSYFPVGTQFLQRSVTIPINPMTHDQQLANICWPTELANKCLSCVINVGQKPNSGFSANRNFFGSFMATLQNSASRLKIGSLGVYTAIVLRAAMLILVLVLKDSVRTKFKSLPLSLQVF